MANEGLTVNVNVTDTELFKELLDVLKYAYDNTSKEMQEEISYRINNLIGKTHCIKDFKCDARIAPIQK